MPKYKQAHNFCVKVCLPSLLNLQNYLPPLLAKTSPCPSDQPLLPPLAKGTLHTHDPTPQLSVFKRLYIFVTVQETANFVNVDNQRKDEMQDRFVGGSPVTDATWYPFMVALFLYSKLSILSMKVICICTIISWNIELYPIFFFLLFCSLFLRKTKCGCV